MARLNLSLPHSKIIIHFLQRIRHNEEIMSRYKHLILLLVLLLVAAKHSYQKNDSGHGPGKATNQPTENQQQPDPQQETPPPPPPAPADAPPAHQANPELAKAVADLQDLDKKLKGEFEASPEYTQALADVKQAQTDYDAAAKEALAGNERYTAGVAAQKDLESKLDAARKNSDERASIATLAIDAMNNRMAVRHLEEDACAADPKARDAKTKLKTAQDALSKMRHDFQASLSTNADYAAAKKAVDDARTPAKK